jgi:hypothetical protein
MLPLSLSVMALSIAKRFSLMSNGFVTTSFTPPVKTFCQNWV